MRRLLLTLIIWILCFTAIVAGAVLTYNWYRNLGPEISISFLDASGVVPHQTPISYRGVYVGWVQHVRLNQKTGRAEVIARMHRDVADLLAEGTEFWVVKPEFSLEHSSNLGTIASGDYIGMRPQKGKVLYSFTGLDNPPVRSELAEGLQVLLHGPDGGGVNIGSPILYKGLQIGEVGELGVTKNKREVLVTAYIYKKYADLVRTSSFFGNVSGFHASIHILGSSQVGMDSLKTLLSGGIVMETNNLEAPQAKSGAEYELIPPEAMQRITGGG